MSNKIKTTRKNMCNNKEIKVNLTFNTMSQETAKKFVMQVKNCYNENIISDIKKVG